MCIYSDQTILSVQCRLIKVTYEHLTNILCGKH